MSPNPYAPPVVDEPRVDARAHEGDGRGLWRQGDRVVAAHGAKWPDRCVRCNAPAGGYRRPFSLSWHPPWLLTLVPAGVIPYLVAAPFASKSAVIEVGLCNAHRRRERRWLAAAWLGALASAITCAATMGSSRLVPKVAAFVLAALMVLGVLLRWRPRATGIDEHAVELRCGRLFVQSLPLLSGPSAHAGPRGS